MSLVLLLNMQIRMKLHAGSLISLIEEPPFQLVFSKMKKEIMAQLNIYISAKRNGGKIFIPILDLNPL